MEDWRRRTLGQLLGRDLADPDGNVALEMTLGMARAEITYVLEFARSHQLPATGSVFGDDVWFRLGATTMLRFHFSRRAGVIVASVVGYEDAQLKWSPERRAIVGADGAPVDVGSYVRQAVEATVLAWRASQQEVKISRTASNRPPQPTLPDIDDHPPRTGRR